MYVIGGEDSNFEENNSIEKLSNVTGPLLGAVSRWQLIQPINSFLPRYLPVFCAWNMRELVILGGGGSSVDIHGDAWILDTRNDQLR